MSRHMMMLVTALLLLLGIELSSTTEKENVVIVSSKGVNEEKYFQLSGFPSGSVLHRLSTADANPTALYGYSLASFLDGNTTSFVVGAPKLGKRGEVHRCTYTNIDKKESAFQCKPLDFVGLRSSSISDDDGMFLGGSVSALSTGDQALMLYCGHLYKQTTSMDGDKSMLLSIGLCNLKRSKGSGSPIVINPCDVVTSCLAGFSSDLANSVDGKNTLIGVGMPNIVKDYGTATVTSLPRIGSDKLTKMTYSHNQNKKTFYTGFNIAFGRTQNSEALYVTTPLHYEKMPVKSTVERFRRKKGPLTEYGEFVDSAKHIGGFYGFSLASVKMSPKHKASTLLVGEPFYTDFNENKMDVGRVYIYCRSQTIPLILQGETENSLFGYSIAVVGDFNNDRSADFAVGCPYCDDGHGAVYIFQGDEFCKIGRPVQIIRAREVSKLLKLSPPLQGFGWSLSGGTDFDKNGYKDLLIGTPLSNSVVLARARSVVKVDCWIHPKCKVDGDKLIEGTCGSFNSNKKRGCSCEAMIKFGLTPSFPGNVKFRDLEFNITIDLDARNKEKEDKRVFNGPDGDSIFSQKLSFKDERPEKLSKVLNFLPMVSSKAYQRDTNTELIMKATVTLSNSYKSMTDEKGRLMPSPSIQIVKEKLSSKKCEAKVDISYVECFEEPCKCDLDLRILWKASTDRPASSQNSKSRIDNITRRVDYPVKNQTIYILLENEFDSQDAKYPGVLMYFRNGLRFMQARVYNKRIGKDEFSCIELDATRVSCNFLKASATDSTVSIEIQVDFSKYFVIADSVASQRKSGKNVQLLPPQFEAVTQTASHDTNPSNNRVLLNYTVVYRPNITIVEAKSDQTKIDDRNTSVTIRKKARVYVDQVGPSFRHAYQLSNSGPSPAHGIIVNISIPVATENGDYLIYLFKEVRTGSDNRKRNELTETNVLPRVVSESGQSTGKCFVPPEVINPHDITVIETHEEHVQTILDDKANSSNSGSETRSRRRRSVEAKKEEERVEPERAGGPLQRRNKEFIECGVDSLYLGRPRCVTIRCEIEKLPVNDAVRIIVDGWLWARTIVGRKISDVEVMTKAHGEIGVDNKIPNGIGQAVGLKFGPLNITTNFVFPNVKLPVIRRIPIWPIILGIILGILLLAAIIILLYCCGFFKRRRPKPQPEPQHHFVLDVAPPNDRNHHDMEKDSTPLIPKVKGPTSRKDSTDDMIEQEFADMERSIMTSANEIEMRRKTEEDEEVDRLVRQVSTHEPVPSERPPNFPVDMWLAVSGGGALSETTSPDQDSDKKEKEDEKEEEEEEKEEEKKEAEDEKQEEETEKEESEKGGDKEEKTEDSVPAGSQADETPTAGKSATESSPEDATSKPTSPTADDR